MKRIATTIGQHKQLFVGLALFALIAIMPACATATTGIGAFDTAYSFIKGLIVGPLGIAAATIGIGVCGFLIAVSKGQGVMHLIWIIVGIAIVFGGPNILQGMGMSGVLF